MLEIARFQESDRNDMFRFTAQRAGMSEAIVEKDFWVCWMLEILFHHFEYSEALCFKGGTSLSKAYGLVQRFSEDIDLILDWRILGYGQNEPWIDRTNTSQDNFNWAVNEKTVEFLEHDFMPKLKSVIKEMGIEDSMLYIDPSDRQTIRFAYPKSFSDDALVQEIRLEIGSLAAWTPMTERNISPFVVDDFSHFFTKPTSVIRTVEAKRTFWEKATILHAETYRVDTLTPSRYSRHYYDIYMLSLSGVKMEAFEDMDLLDKVARFKMKFYRSNRSRYDLANKDNLQLIPTEDNIEKLEKDYRDMQSMLYGEIVPFSEIINGIKDLQDDIRNISVTRSKAAKKL